MSNTITITRAERDVIRDQISYWTPAMYGDPVPFGTCDEATDRISKLERAVALYDELGWEDDDSRTTFTVTVDAVTVELVRQRAEDFASEIAGQIDYRDTHILKLRPTTYGTTWADDFETIEDAHASVAARIKDAEDEVRACESLLKRMDAEAVTA